MRLATLLENILITFPFSSGCWIGIGNMVNPRNLLRPKLYLIKARSIFIKRKLSNKNSKVIMNNPFYKITIVKKKGAVFNINGTLKLISDCGQTNRTYIDLEENATLQIDGDFWIGNGVRILVAKNGLLKIGGRDKESESGITSNSTIFTYSKIDIGKDFLCAWDVFITDSDWHYLEFDGVPQLNSDVSIGNHVWVTNNCSILKGTKIGNNCVIGNYSLLSDKTYPDNSLIAGIPAKILKQNCKWSRDLPESQAL
jgi:hypothetical protein